MGNITSVANAVEKVGHKHELISDPNKIRSSDFIILPGVGAFSKAMNSLKENGLDEAIFESVGLGKRILGICLGMQLLFSRSFEFGVTEGLNLVMGEVLPFNEMVSGKVPHIGWNNVISTNHRYKAHEGDYYFVHSFYCKPERESDVLFSTNYDIDFCSAINSNDQIFGVQFHPEKSQKLGLDLLRDILG